MEAKDVTEAVNQRIYRNIVRLIGDRKHIEICKKAGVPESTLSTQLAKQRFTLDLLAPLAPALGTTVAGLVEGPGGELPVEIAAAAFYRVQDNLEWARAMAESAASPEDLARVLAEEVAPRIPPDDEPGQESAPGSTPGSPRPA